MYEHLVSELTKVSLSMFKKNFFGIFHGSISTKLDSDKFLINSRRAIFDELQSGDFIELYLEQDYRYKDASIDSYIHRNIYKNISEAKYICYSMPPNITAYTLKQSRLVFLDYFGSQNFKNLEIYDPKDFKDWYNRAPNEIANYLKNESSFMIIKGYGIYAYGRDLNDMVKRVAIIENSAKMLLMSQNIKSIPNIKKDYI
jgi:L-fuculose-phosphate aldolase